MATPAASQHLDIYSYCQLLQLELQRLHDRLDRLEHDDAASSTPRGHSWRPYWDGVTWTTGMSRPPTPAPTPAVIAVSHTNIPLAELLPTAAGSPDRYSCTLVVPDAAVGHIVGHGGKGLHQAQDVSGAQLRAYTDKVSPAERRVSIRGTDQQIGDALIALGKCFMHKRVRPKKKGSSHPSEGTAPPPAGPACAPPPASMNVDPRVPQHRAHPAAARKPVQAFPPHDAGNPPPIPVNAAGPSLGKVRFAPQQSSIPASEPLPRGRAAATPTTQLIWLTYCETYGLLPGQEMRSPRATA
ncbi:hypothetical protein GGX14DRAFT_391148 [Mycena pura]|uniref:K Homology domain-containing protein n=1 Tax=Mycena pura TaxID=153505 RepID=A0AAD6VM36_9AGAR|nr:hypothetical protein GGX14DRAFT_391148 [Mycena pura]